MQRDRPKLTRINLLPNYKGWQRLSSWRRRIRDAPSDNFGIYKLFPHDSSNMNVVLALCLIPFIVAQELLVEVITWERWSYRHPEPFPTITLETYPSFSGPVKIVVSKGNQGVYTLKYRHDPVVGRKFRVDQEALQQTPIIEWERPIPQRKALKLMHYIRSVSVNVLPKDAYAGLFDGTTWRLTIQDADTTLRIEWWQHLPRNWRAIWKIVKVMTALADEGPGVWAGYAQRRPGQ